jgi:transposase
VDYCEIARGGAIERAVLAWLSQLETRLGPATPPARVAFEACREGWYAAERLSTWGHEPVMVDTTRVRQLGIGQHGRKNDRIDAEVLATALAPGRIPQANILSPARQKLRLELAVRESGRLERKSRESRRSNKAARGRPGATRPPLHSRSVREP